MTRGIDRLTAIENRLAKITRWPWRTQIFSWLNARVLCYFDRNNSGDPVAWLDNDKGYKQVGGFIRFGANCSNAANDATFVAHAPADISDLLKVAKAARGLMATVGEFPEDPSIWGEALEALDVTLERLDPPPPKESVYHADT